MDEARGISKLDLKRRNRKQILLSIREAGKLARVDIARRLALTRAAVTIITNTMVQQGILVDLPSSANEESGPRTRGRKKTMICINTNYKFVFGAAITEHMISVGLANLGGEVLDKTTFEVNDETELQEITSLLAKTIKKMLHNSSLEPRQILGLGIGVVPSRVKLLRGEPVPAGISFSRMENLLEMELEMPVHINNLIGLYALANVDHPAHRYITQILLYSGDAYHSAVVSGNELISGSSINTNAINRYIVTPNGEPAEGYPNGSVYAELTKPTVIRRAAAIMKRDPADLGLDEINKAYQKGDKKIIALLNETIEKLAFLIYNIAVPNNVRRVVLQSFSLIPETEKLLREALAKLTGPDSDKLTLDISRLTPEHSFVAGSNWCVEKQFIELGGMTRVEGGVVYGYDPQDRIEK